ncbi:Sedlin [Tilletiaria anomala UBC 951]|uniref:Sedlin n=1 Tax=Tilletiaria anomala (strain ATCC 24038 / CBS 436.72 / UBC 951) TaxID=1037660 RepID=A0A066VHS7_TILAU|nr:Sedlin [Tilletiaria anomala UBC 951]KDN38145.1 Sedlin [Tilletiaria anomala UBC 951]
MSYYFCIVGTRDNPLYEADLAARSTASLGPSSFFSSSSSTGPSSAGPGSGFSLRSTSPAPSASSFVSSNPSSSSVSAGTGGADGASRSSLESASTAPTDTNSAATSSGAAQSSSSGSVFGFGIALGALAGGLSGLAGASSLSARGGGAAGSGGGLTGQGRGLGFGRYNDKDVLQMVALSSLDAIEDMQFFNGAMYMKSVDRINEWTTSAFLVPGNVKFLILHEHKHEDGIRNFFIDVWELWVKITMNPFRDINDPIRSATFDQKVRASARRYL